MEYKLLLVFFLQHLITSLPVDEDDLFYDDDDDDDTSPVDFSTLDTSPQLYQVELEDIKLLNQLVEIITPEFFDLKANGTICGLSYFISAQKMPIDRTRKSHKRSCFNFFKYCARMPLVGK